ncbi:hypothetical protein [Cellulomonas sp. NPDC089187]|uniref:hypothetical protein n=1 Tax=Cellulomonas sp. NPDC089187 TaxID=3154970 RepID=UPI0034383931
MSSPLATTPRPARTQALIAVGVIVVAVPASLAAVLGLLMLQERTGADWGPEPFQQALSWWCAFLLAVTLWPLLLRAGHRAMWQSRVRASGARIALQGNPPVPRVHWGATGWTCRVAVVALGGLSIVLLSGPRQVTDALIGGLRTMSGGLSIWALQIVPLLVMVGVLALLMLASRLAERRSAPQDRQAWQVREAWYWAAGVAWVCTVAIGLCVGLAIRTI